MENQKFLEDIAYRAGEIILKYFRPGGLTPQLKEDRSPVTMADIEVNQMVIEEMRNNFPSYGILGEEESFNPENSNLLVVDPLDGTKMFAVGSPLFSFSAAFVKDGVPVSGVLYNPLAKRMIIAEKGKGAFLVLERTPIRVSPTPSYSNALIDNGWDGFDSKVSPFIHKEGGYTPMIYTICESAALLATGGFDGIIFTGKNPWDIAAAKVIVEEAGGKVTDLYGNEQRYDRPIKGAVLSNGVLHNILIKSVADSGLLNDL